MDRKRDSGSGRSDHSPEEAWLREALAPEVGSSERLVAAALAAGDGEGRGLLRWGGLAAAAVLALAFGWVAFFLRPAPAAGPAGGGHPGGTLRMTNAGGVVRLERTAPEPAPMPPMVRPAPSGPCTTVYWSRGSVLAVYESCGDGTIRIEGGAS